jgi:uncharacterized protein
MNIMRFRTALLYGLLFVLSFAICGATYAYAAEDERRIYDKAGLLTASEYEELEAMCLEYEETAKAEIFILTHNNSNTVSPESYIEDFEDRMPAADRVYFLYDVYRGEIFIEGYGTAETYIHSKRIDKIFDQMVDDLRAGNYYDAFATYIKLAAAYMNDDSEINTDHDYSYNYSSDPNYSNTYDYEDRNYGDAGSRQAKSFLTNPLVQMIAALFIGAIVVTAMAYHSGGVMTVRGDDYLDRSRSGLIGRRDIYLRTTITRVRKPTQNTSSGSRSGGFNAGGFRGGVSAGGRSHSSGGRKL